MLGIHDNYGYGFGRLWAPERQRLVVGRDVAPIRQDKNPQKEISPIVLPGAGDQAQAARQRYSFAAGQARLGFSLREDISVSAASGEEAGSLRQEQLLGQSASEKVYLVSNGGQTGLRIVNAEGEDRLLNLTGKEDMRIGWSEDGRAEVFVGEAALTGGKLVAQGENDILVRFSSADVEAGKGSTVLNLAGERGGKFSGGHNVRYLGAYQDTDIEGGSGENFFEGYFGSCRINAEKGKNTFSGVFNGLGSGSFIRTGAEQDVFSGYFDLMNVTDTGGKNVFSGAFLAGSSIDAGSGDDTFGGQFFHSRINDQGGDNIFGSRLDLTGPLQLNFAHTVIEAGGGADTFFGAAAESEVKLGGGADEANGIFLNGTLDAGQV